MGEITHDQMDAALRGGANEREVRAMGREYVQQQRTRPPHGEVRVVEQVVASNAEPYRVDLPAPLDVRVSLEPGQSLAIVEPSPGVTVTREVLEKVLERLHFIEQHGPIGMKHAAQNALALLKDSPHA